MPKHPRVAASVEAMPGSVYTALAHKLATYPGEVYPFHVGDTWMEPAEGCRMEDLTVADHPGMHRYAPPQGLPALLDAIVETTRKRTGVTVERDQVLVTAGATGALGAVCGALLEAGNEVLIAAPYWPLIAGIVQSYRGVPVPVDLLGSSGPDDAVERFERARTERTVAVYWSTPNNPTGTVLEPGVLEALAGWAQRNELWIFSDEVYEHYVYGGEHHYSLPLAPERTFSVHSASKAFGMAGNRCGWVVGPTEVLVELRKVSTHTFYSTPTASQLAAVRALAGAGQTWAAEASELYAAMGAKAARRLGVPEPAGSTFLFLDAADRLDQRGLAGFLEDAADRGVFVAPGPSFGPYPTHIRVCFTAAPPEVVERGTEVLAELLGR